MRRTGQALVVQGDLRHSEPCKRVVKATLERLGTVRVLINNAGALFQRKPVTEINDALPDDILDSNLRAMMRGIRCAVSFMTEAGGIINPTSVAARRGGAPGRPCPPAPRGSSAPRPRVWPRSGWAVGSLSMQHRPASCRGPSTTSLPGRAHSKPCGRRPRRAGWARSTNV
ncbi:MAG: SDR family NAD(P)-dependent oxidoreductase [Rubrivivax sp.]|nr:SDR family NAD(P)-dependent oxidoreductase [Rubrivivax sp.]